MRVRGALDVPAARYNAIAAAVQVDRGRIPFSVRQDAVLAAEAVVVAWEENHAKWCALHDEIDLLKGIIRELGGTP